MSKNDEALELFDSWYNGLKVHSSSGGPARGTIGAALVVLERLKENFDLNLDSHRAAGRSQIKGASGAAVAEILKKFGEERPYLKEGGRTNRGGPGDIEDMLLVLSDASLDKIVVEERNVILGNLQGYLVEKVKEYHNRERIKIIYDPANSLWQTIKDLLAIAGQTGKEGPVAQYLVGAKLQLRFPSIPIRNDSYSTADDQTGSLGDFCVGDTAFHVTIAPMPAIYEKCKQNINQGIRTYLLVPDGLVVGAKQNAENLAPGRISVVSIESFVSQNIDEISEFSNRKLVSGFRRLLEKYNERVNTIENDKSMLIEIPKNLQ